MPNEFNTYLNYCRQMKFEEKPDIAYLRKLFKDLFFRMGYDYDFVFDWMVKKPGTATIGDKPEEENQFYQNQANQESAAALPDNNEGQNEEQDNLE